MSRKIILSADGTCDIGPELKERYDVHLYPMHIILDGKDYIDSVTITPEQIFQTYYDKGVLPKTTAINASEYADSFRQWVEDGYDVIHISLASSLSSSYQNCCIAAAELGHVYPIDSRSLSTGTGLLVIEAGEMIAAGMEAADIAARVQEMAADCHASFILDTLKFLSAGGRCSSVVALGANILGIKPCIEVSNVTGKMGLGKKYRGSLEKVLVQYTQDKLKEYPNIRGDHVFITHSGIDPSYIQAVRDVLVSSGKVKEIHVTKASCTISSHCGPNVLGVLFETK